MTASLAGATQLLAEARAQSDNGNAREALTSFQEVLATLLHHKSDPTCSSQLHIAIADTHDAIAKVQREIVQRNLVEDNLKSTFKDRSACHLRKATEILRVLSGEENKLTLNNSFKYNGTTSITGTTELRVEARAQRDNGHPIEALLLFQEVLTNLLHHNYEPPFSTELDVADAHVETATMLREIVQRDLVENHLTANYRAMSANHLLQAAKTRRHFLGEEHELTLEVSEMITNC